MVEQLLTLERDAFFALNGSDYAFLDRFMWIFTGKVVWLPLAAFLIFMLVYRKNWREWLLVFLAIALTITLCDQFASHICKPYFLRFRPTHHPDFMDQVKVVFDYRGGMYGFISSHAANAFGFAMLISLILKNKLASWTFFLWAALTAYTRIYLGVHFITDIIPGAISGVVFGGLVYLLYRYVRNRWILPESQKDQPLYSPRRAHYMAYAVWIVVFAILVLNQPLVALLRG